MQDCKKAVVKGVALRNEVGYITSLHDVGVQGLSLSLSGPTHSFESDPAERDSDVLSALPD